MDPLTRDEEALAQAVARDLAIFRDAPVTFVLRPELALGLAVLLQQALRDPTLAGPNAAGAARVVIAHVRTHFDGAPALRDLLRRGDL